MHSSDEESSDEESSGHLAGERRFTQSSVKIVDENVFDTLHNFSEQIDESLASQRKTCFTRNGVDDPTDTETIRKGMTFFFLLFMCFCCLFVYVFFLFVCLFVCFFLVAQ